MMDSAKRGVLFWFLKGFLESYVKFIERNKIKKGAILWKKETVKLKL